jgi:hypothetical protein
MNAFDSREKLSTTYFHNISNFKLNEETCEDDTSPRGSPSPVGEQTKKKGGLSKFTLDYNEEMERVITHFEHRKIINESRLSESNR